MSNDFLVFAGICLAIVRLIVSIVGTVRRKQGTTVVEVKHVVVKIRYLTINVRKPPKR